MSQSTLGELTETVTDVLSDAWSTSSSLAQDLASTAADQVGHASEAVLSLVDSARDRVSRRLGAASTPGCSWPPRSVRRSPSAGSCVAAVPATTPGPAPPARVTSATTAPPPAVDVLRSTRWCRAHGPGTVASDEHERTDGSRSSSHAERTDASRSSSLTLSVLRPASSAGASARSCGGGVGRRASARSRPARRSRSGSAPRRSAAGRSAAPARAAGRSCARPSPHR